jgi:hypothetical protein
MATITRIIGESGRRYVVERILQEKSGPLGRVYLASCVSSTSFKLYNVLTFRLQGWQSTLRPEECVE